MRLSTAAIPPLQWRKSASLVMAAPAAAFGGPSSDGFDYKICMLKRFGKGTFRNAYVFPGGALDAEDEQMAAKMPAVRLAANPDDTVAMRVCAVRESFEEAGAQVFSKRVPESWREKVGHDSTVFAEMLAETGAVPAVADLHFWCSFTTPDSEARKMKKGGFHTSFYFTVVDAANVAAMRCDGRETTVLEWLTPPEALAAFKRGELMMPPPQWTVLTELQSRSSMASLAGFADSEERTLIRDHPIKPYLLEATDKKDPAQRGVFMAYPGDALHPVYAAPHGVNRLQIKAGGYVRHCNLPPTTRLTAAKL